MIRNGEPVLPKPDDVLEAGDEMLFFAGGPENQARALVRGALAPFRNPSQPGR
jgi:trk system potassium uptake protein TrkA